MAKFVFPSGQGQFDIRHEFKADGTPNPRFGQPYAGISHEQIAYLVANPMQVAKEEAWWFIPSHGTDCSSRLKAHQEEYGWFYGMTVDLDKGNLPKETVIQLLQAALPDTSFMLYSSRGSKPDQLKWRAILWNKTYVAGSAYESHCVAVYERIEEIGSAWFKQWGLGDFAVDRAPRQPNQVAYLPNRGEFYDHHIQPGGPLDYAPFQERIAELQAIRDGHRLRVANSTYDVGNNVIGTFNAHFDLETMFAMCGYQQIGKSWSSPYQQASSGGAATDIKVGSDGLPYWISLSDSDRAVQTLGTSSASGNRTGDAFALFRHYFHQDDQDAAIRDARLRLVYGIDPNHADPNLRSNEAMVAHGQANWDAVLQVEKEAQLRYAEENRAELERIKADEEAAKLAADRGYTKYTLFGKLPGFVGAVADWIERHYMWYDNPEIAKVTAMFAVAAFVGRKDSFRGASPVLSAVGLGISGVGKNTIDEFQKDIIDLLSWKFPEDFNGDILNVFKPLDPHEGLKAYNVDMAQRLSAVEIMPEAGLSKTSKAGDRVKVRGIKMQNITVGAYKALNFTSQSSGMYPVYGVNHSAFEESTLETYKAHMTSEQLVSGENARKLFMVFDVSRGNTNVAPPDRKFPDWLVNGFYALAKEALREEELALGVMDGDRRIPGTIRPKMEATIEFTAEPEVEERLNSLYSETRQNRLDNTENVAGMDWGHKSGRQGMLYNQLCLLFARTERVVGHRAEAVIRMQDYETADMLIKASQATERGNYESFGNPLDDVCHKILVMVAKFFSTGSYSKTYERYVGANNDADELYRFFKFPWSMVTANPVVSRLADELANGNYTKARVWQDIKTHGEENLGYWQIEQTGKKTFLIPDVSKLSS